MILSDKELTRACCRAIYLWELGDDTVDSSLRVSDKDLLSWFASSWMDHKNNQTQINYSSDHIHKLIYNCQVRLSQLANPTLLDINKYLNDPSVLSRYNFTYAAKVRLRDRWNRGREFNEELASQLNESKVAGTVIPGSGDQKALASRVLFFAMPELHIFNYSGPLIESLKSRRCHIGSEVSEVYEVMNDLLNSNLKELKKLPRPKFTSKHGISKAIKLGDWWERRVLDLALLENWKCYCRE
jgi:hypothetical protein